MEETYYRPLFNSTRIQPVSGGIRYTRIEFDENYIFWKDLFITVESPWERIKRFFTPKYSCVGVDYQPPIIIITTY